MTDRPVVPRALALADIDAATDNYLREGGEAAALRFIEAVERAFAHIAAHPGTGSPRYAWELDLPDLRHWPLRRFPYLAFYVEAEDRIDLWRVLHAHRNIPAWLHGPDEKPDEGG